MPPVVDPTADESALQRPVTEFPNGTGFVEHEQPRVAQQRGGHTEPMPHPEGVPADLVLPVAQVDRFQDLVDAGAAGASVEAGEQLQVLAAGQPGVELRLSTNPATPSSA